MKKMFWTIIITVILLIMGATNVFAASKTCAAIGCNRIVSEKTSYCKSCSCAHPGCPNKKQRGARYCYCHLENSNSSKSSTHSTNSKKSTKSTNSYKSSNKSKSKNHGWESYDNGYEDVWLDDDYDWDRYQRDSDYADGVDDAMEDWDW